MKSMLAHFVSYIVGGVYPSSHGQSVNGSYGGVGGVRVHQVCTRYAQGGDIAHHGGADNARDCSRVHASTTSEVHHCLFGKRVFTLKQPSPMNLGIIDRDARLFLWLRSVSSRVFVRRYCSGAGQ